MAWRLPWCRRPVSVYIWSVNNTRLHFPYLWYIKIMIPCLFWYMFKRLSHQPNPDLVIHTKCMNTFTTLRSWYPNVDLAHDNLLYCMANACSDKSIQCNDIMRGVSQWASCQIRIIAGCACAENAGIVFPATAGKRSRHASRHVRDARAVMQVVIANQRFPLKSASGENDPGIPGACATRSFTYLVRGPWGMSPSGHC